MSEKKPPSYFADIYPWSSCYQQAEYERIAQNIMLILKRTGNTFRSLDWEEYKTERMKDNISPSGEKEYFNKTIQYCKSSNTARVFSKKWNWE